jgi:hypothetical protein
MILSLCQFVPAFAQETNASDLLKISGEMVQTAARLRGLSPKEQIKQGVKTKEEISGFLDERVKADYSKGELDNEGKMLRILGLIPADINYKEFVMKLLTEQVGGFYDPDKKTFFIASWLPEDEQKPVMIHELTHALQDQYFDVGRILKSDRDSNNDDRTLAHEALLEGDGMVVMLQYILEPMKRHFSDLPNLAFVMRNFTSPMQSQFPVFKSAPAFLKELLLFPYGYGASFLQYVWKQSPSWETVNKIYSDLPSSTEQIMHPEKYCADRDMPKPVNAENLVSKLGGSWKVAYKNVMGEFSLGLLLSLHLTEERSRRAASGWGGDQVLLIENKEGKDAVLISTVWDTQDDSDRYFSAMDDWFQLHYPNVQRINVQKINETPIGFSVLHNGELNLIRREGTSVRFIIGLPEADSKNLKDF